MRKKLPPKPTTTPEDNADAELARAMERQRAAARQRAAGRKAERADADPTAILENAVSSAIEMQAATAEIAGASEELEGTLGEIAAATRQAAASADLSLEAMRGVLGGARRSQERAAVALARSERLQALVRAASDGVTDLARGVDSANAAGAAASARVRQLQSRAGEIREIARQVGQSADAINLFAFNAALEASRAGRHGAGFSIVSDEVRALARRASESTERINTVLAGVDVAVAQVVDAMGASLEVNRASLVRADAVLELLGGCNQATEDLRAGGALIDERARRLASVMVTTEENSASIAAATEQSAASTRQSTAVLGEQNQAMRGIADAAVELAAKTTRARDGGPQATLMEEMGTIIDELGATIQEAASSARQIAASIHQIASAASQLSGITAQNLPAIVQAAAVTDQISAAAAQALERSAALQGQLGAATRDILEVVGDVERSAGTNAAAAANVRAVTDELLRIDAVIDDLLSISIMTSLLSVSGRIEGARGRRGRGLHHRLRGHPPAR